jgi:isopentenyldiphosphate isomerase
MNPADEIVAIVDKQNNVIGAVPRREMRAKRLLHRSTYILVFNSQGALYVQKRTMTKDVFPGYFDPATGGVVLTGESYEVSAVRELEEEMGIRDVPLHSLFDFYFEDEHARVWGRAFSCTYDGKIVPQVEEVAYVEMMTTDDILRRAETEQFTPDGVLVVQRYLEERYSVPK